MHGSAKYEYCTMNNGMELWDELVIFLPVFSIQSFLISLPSNIIHTLLFRKVYRNWPKTLLFVLPGISWKGTHRYLFPQAYIDSLHWTSVHSKYIFYEISCTIALAAERSNVYLSIYIYLSIYPSIYLIIYMFRPDVHTLGCSSPMADPFCGTSSTDPRVS